MTIRRPVKALTIPATSTVISTAICAFMEISPSGAVAAALCDRVNDRPHFGGYQLPGLARPCANMGPSWAVGPPNGVLARCAGEVYGIGSSVRAEERPVPCFPIFLKHNI